MYTENQVTHPEVLDGGSHPAGSSPRRGIQHILVCLGGETESDLCIAHAMSLAHIFDSSVTLMHVMQHRDDRFGPHTTDALGWEITRQEAAARLEVLEKEAARTSGRRVGVRLVQGRPAERIVALTRELGADLVVLGSHGRRDHPSWELGSTAQQVLAAARSSVLIARGSASSPLFVPPRRVLVPLDGSQRTESVLPTAQSIAKGHDAQLVLLHVVAEPLPTRVLAAPEDLQSARDLASRLEVRAARYLETLRHQVGYDDSMVDTLVERQADKRQFLVEFSERTGIDLIVLSAHGATCDVARAFGSVTAHLLTHSRVPLLVLQDLPKSEVPSDEEVDEGRAAAARGPFVPESI